MRAFVHIGMTKTGTTSIQLGMWRRRKILAKRGICYPDIRRNHGEVIGSLFVTDPNHWAPNARWGINAEQQNPETWCKLNRALSSQPKMLIISGEALFGLPPNAVARMVDWLRLITEDFRIIAYFREPKAWATSSAQQHLKSGKPLDELLQSPPVPRIRERLERWIAACGKERIAVSDFNVARRHPCGIAGHFVEQLGLADLAGVMAGFHVNQSLSADALHKITELTQERGRRLTREEREEIAAAVESTEPFRLPDNVLAAVERASRADVEWLASEFGINLA